MANNKDKNINNISSLDNDKISRVSKSGIAKSKNNNLTTQQINRSHKAQNLYITDKSQGGR